MNTTATHEPKGTGYVVAGLIAIWAVASILAFGIGAGLRAIGIASRFVPVLVVVVGASLVAHWWLLGHTVARDHPVARAGAALVLSLITYWAAISTVFAIATIVVGA
jgi:hypothetical protein